jgi:hypothetical protein
LEELERRERERAIVRTRGFWHSLSVEEMALMCAAVQAQQEGLELTPEERAALDRADGMDGVLMTAIGWHEGMSEAEEGARIHRLMAREDVFDGRDRAVRRRYLELVGSRGSASRTERDAEAEKRNRKERA